jgi:hypothetical protein
MVGPLGKSSSWKSGYFVIAGFCYFLKHGLSIVQLIEGVELFACDYVWIEHRGTIGRF